MAFSFVTSLLVEAVSRFIPVILVLTVFRALQNRKRAQLFSKNELAHTLGVYIFCIYLLIVLCVTGIPLIAEARFDSDINLVPFIDIKSHPDQYLLNFVMFLPYGALLPLLWSKYDKMRSVLLSGALFSLSIELIQLFELRISDIDDWMMNTVGAIAGYYLYLLVKKAIPQISVFRGCEPEYYKREAYFCIAVSWLTMFFVRPFQFTVIS